METRIKLLLILLILAFNVKGQESVEVVYSGMPEKEVPVDTLQQVNPYFFQHQYLSVVAPLGKKRTARCLRLLLF